MTELDDDEALILAQARRALGPTSADERRVLQSLLPQLAAPLGGPSSSLRPGPSWTLRAGFAMAVIGAVALSGGLGYRKGLEAGIAQQNKANVRVNPIAVASPPPPPPLKPEVPLPNAPERLLPRDAKSSSAPSAARVRSASPVALVPPVALGLDEEVRQLRRVERAIRESNPRLALVLLEDLDREIPKGQLLEERQAASLMANCQLGADAAVAHARAFATKHAGSAYLMRVIEICGLGSAATERISPAAGTHVPR